MNTELKDKIRKAAYKASLPFCGNRAYTVEKYFIAGAEAMYAELAPLVEWVSVKERLPQENETVLVKEIGYLGRPFVNIVYGWEEDRLGRGIDITHWKKIDL